MGLAVEMDRLGARATESEFSYFTRTSAKPCERLVAKHDFDKLTALRFYIEKIENCRLRRQALEGHCLQNLINQCVRDKRIVSSSGKAR